MAEEQTEEQVQQELFQQAVAPPEIVAEPPKPAPEPPAPVPPHPPTSPHPEPTGAEAGIPSWRLREEADARRAAEERARTLEERLNLIAAEMQRASAAQPGPAPDFFADPAKATQTVVMEMMKQTITPLVEEMRRNQEETRQGNMARDRMVAQVVHGNEAVNEAEEAFLAARGDESLDPMDYERVVQAPNRYDEVVKWHRRQRVMSSVGDDPAAWFDKELEARMGDPQFQAKLMERARTGAASRPSAVRLPPSLSKVPSAQSNTDRLGDMSDASLFAHAMRRQ